MKYIGHITGYLTADVFFAALTFAFLGFAIHKILTGANRDVKSQRTPGKFSFTFWIKDNWIEAATHFLLLYTVVRFAPDTVKLFAPSWLEFFKSADHMLIYVAVGWLVAYPLNKIKKKLEKK